MEQMLDVLKWSVIVGGAAALLTAIGSRDEKNRQAAIRAAGSGGDTPAERYLRDELAWRL